MLLAAAACLVFGLGMPTPAAYSLVAVLGAPALVQFGVDILAAHLFVFFLANLSAVTPPVALASLVAAKLADAGYMRTAILSARLALPAFIMPFYFVFYPQLLLQGSSLVGTLTVIAWMMACLVAFNAGFCGALFRKRVSGLQRALLIVAAIGLALPPPLAKLAGACLLTAIILQDLASSQTQS
ncbi:TRAP transporter large permease subunit [Paracoccus seriniphilus]|uniref:Tripartite ATP-independent transporter, DctM component n=1 Tax=Paracoccus seriniphilus TaxID=184748 RepID=A0A239Q2K1_9RHOB|nr:TRAP transporter large permease subunit [Paracoccus seriniphilus]WCR15575.1 TRAP transporter large permease subunit [Paracoccus seriniphilus]SNT76734.1 Tripartite ATP-independent transporter, DctM component [Paracoccus seriniphilus]